MEIESLESKANEFFDNGNYKQAFKIYKLISNNELISNNDRSYSFNMLGVIVLIIPDLNETEDESGLYYFKKSFELDNNNIDAILNIINSFGNSVNEHQNKEILEIVINKLKSINYKFTEQELILINQKINI